jgi:methylenetetrahydrofolate dehydrogenase (NADP+) / methenyltetrahydrofolate cyclohydrolase
MYTILEWKTLRDKILEDISFEIKDFNRPPKLCVILVWNNSASKTYVSAKKKACESIGIDFELKEYTATITEEGLKKIIEEVNTDPSIDGCIVQLPLPNHIRSEVVINTLDPRKDVDGFTRINIGKLFLWEMDGHISCTPKGILRLLEHYKITLSWKHVVIIGRSTIVGRPLWLLMQHAGATVTTCHSKTRDIEKYFANADIIIPAVWKENFVRHSMVPTGCVVIDVWINRTSEGKLVGDANFQEIILKADCSPVPGWVGPMTIAMILENTINAYKTLRML